MAAATTDGGVGEAQRCQGTEGQRDIWPGHAASSFHRHKVVQLRAEREPRAPRKTRRAHKQSHVASGRRGRAGLRAGGSSGNKETGQRPGINTAPRQPRIIPGVRTRHATLPSSCAPVSARTPAPTQDPPPSTPVPPLLTRSPPCVPQHLPSAPHPLGKPGRFLAVSPSRPSVASALGTMPFLGQDWRSPGQSWVKTADGWKRFLDEKSGSFVSDLGR